MHKTPYPLLRVVRGGTRCNSPSTAFSVWKRSSSCRHLNSAHVCPGRRSRGHFSRCSETWSSETPTAQYIIYNIKKGLFGDSRRPKNASPSRPSHHQCLTKDQTPWAAPIYESTARTSQRIRARERISDHVLAPSRPRSQSGGQPTHLPHLPRTGVKKPTRRQGSQRP